MPVAEFLTWCASYRLWKTTNHQNQYLNWCVVLSDADCFNGFLSCEVTLPSPPNPYPLIQAENILQTWNETFSWRFCALQSRRAVSVSHKLFAAPNKSALKAVNSHKVSILGRLPGSHNRIPGGNLTPSALQTPTKTLGGSGKKESPRAVGQPITASERFDFTIPLLRLASAASRDSRPLVAIGRFSRLWKI